MDCLLACSHTSNTQLKHRFLALLSNRKTCWSHKFFLMVFDAVECLQTCLQSLLARSIPSPCVYWRGTACWQCSLLLKDNPNEMSQRTHVWIQKAFDCFCLYGDNRALCEQSGQRMDIWDYSSRFLFFVPFTPHLLS